MRFDRTANPQQLKALAAALDSYCRTENIPRDTPEFEEAARLVMAMFNSRGLSAEEISAVLSPEPPVGRISRSG